MTENPPLDNAPASPSAPRDIIAERLAQRMKEREAIQTSEPPKQEESVQEAPKLERKILSFEPKESEAEIAPIEDIPQVPIAESIAEATQSIEASVPKTNQDSPREPRKDRDRGRNRDRNERRPPREPRPEPRNNPDP